MATLSPELKPDGDIALGPPAMSAGVNIQNMTELLRSGTPSQKTVILFEASQMVSHSMPGTVPVVVEAICQSVNEWDDDLQIAAAETLLDLSKECKDSSETIATAALQVIGKPSISEDVYECWGEILVRVLPNLPKENDELCTRIIDMLKKYAEDESKVRRKLSARLLGSISSCLTGEQVETQILDCALKLADDRDTDVRGMLAESLAFIGATTSEEVTSTRIWPTIWGLLQDSDTRIRAVTLRAISNILDNHRKNGLDVLHFSKLLHPIFLKEAALAREVAVKDLCGIDDVAFIMLLILSQVFGQFAYSCAPHFANSTEKEQVFQTFRRMSTCNSAGIRRYCAFNFPGVATIFADKQHGNLARILIHLCVKGGPETRCMLAAGLKDSVEVIAKAGAGTNTIELLFNGVMQFLQDHNPVVQLSLTRDILALLPLLDSSLYSEITETSKPRIDAVFRTLSTVATGNWRAQETLTKQMQEEIPKFSPNALKSYVLPLLYRLAEESPYQVRKSAMAGIAMAIWYLPLLAYREEAMSSFQIEWGASNVFWMRMAFIECADTFAKYASKKMFNKLFATTLFQLADDPVPNVRMRLAHVIPTLAMMSSDSPNLPQVVSRMKSDPDVDVKYVMFSFDDNLNKLQADLETFKANDAKKMEEEAAMEKAAVDSGLTLAPMKQRRGSTTAFRKKHMPLDLSQAEGSGEEQRSGNASPRAASVSSPRKSKTSSPVSLVRRLSLNRLSLGSGDGSKDGSKDGSPRFAGKANSSGVEDSENRRLSGHVEGDGTKKSRGSAKANLETLEAVSSPVTPAIADDSAFGEEEEMEIEEDGISPSGKSSKLRKGKKQAEDQIQEGNGTLKKKKSFRSLGDGLSSGNSARRRLSQKLDFRSSSSEKAAKATELGEKEEDATSKTLTPRHRSLQSMWRDLGKVKKFSRGGSE